MQNSRTGKWGVASVGLVMVGLWSGFGCSDSGDDDGTGGSGTGGEDNDGTGGVGTGGNGTGGDGGSGTGGNGTGGAGTGGNGTGGGYACDESLTGAGGTIYLPNCDEWLGVREGDELDFACGLGGNGGQGGAAGDVPALRSVCEAGSEPDFNQAHPVFHCLDEITDDVCSADHYDDVVECVTQEAPCDEDLDRLGCADILDECGALGVGTCFWAMTSARNPGYIEGCFDQAVNGESCEERFMRCAWDL